MALKFSFIAPILIIFQSYKAHCSLVGSNVDTSLTRNNYNIIHPLSLAYNQQGYCANVEALKLSEAGKSEGEWSAVKVTPLPKPLPKEFDLNVNFCSIFSYDAEVCQDIYLEISDNEDDHSLSLDSQAQNNRTKTIIHITNNVKLLDKSQAIYQGKPAFVEEIFEDGHSKIDDTIPKVILSSQGEAFAKIGKSPRNRWMIFQTCDTHNTCVLIDANMKAEELPTYEKEYLAALSSLKIDVKNMVDVPVSFDKFVESPFQQSMYNLNDK